MPQKTIIIGIGSQGYAICNLLAKRIESEFGSLEHVPWLRMLVFETESAITATPLGQKGIAKRIGINADTFVDMTTHPEKYSDSIDLPTWADTAWIAKGGVPTNGANNLRMTGRLCFLSPDNFGVFDDLFQKTYHELFDLKEADATKRRGNLRDGTNPNVAFIGKDDDKTPPVRVFVVGSLTGGTNSGCFVDVGYYLQNIPGVSANLGVFGIFSVPHEAYGVEVHWGNAYGALTELNHFYVKGKRYSGKFSKSQDRVFSSMPPFGTAFIVHPRGGGKAGVELSQLVHAISEVLHLSSVSSTGNAIEAKLADPLGNYANERDRDGRPMPFASLGASAVVFPVEHILDGCAARLAYEALDEILQRREVPETEVDDVRRSLAISAEAYQALMLAHPMVEEYLRNLGRQATQAANSALKGDTNALPNISVTVKGDIAKAFHSSDQNFQGEFRESIHAVAESVATGRVNILGNQVTKMLLSPAMGIVWAEAMLDMILQALQERSSQLKVPQTDIGIRVVAQSSEQKANHFASSIGEKKGCLPFGAKAKRLDSIEQWKEATQDNWRASFLIESEAFEKRTIERLAEECTRLKSRLSDPHNGLKQFLEHVRDRLKAKAEQLDEAGPIVNGLALFEPHKTISEEYKRCLKNEAAESNARAKVRSDLVGWLEEVLKEHGVSAYDRVRPTEFQDIGLALESARRAFTMLHSERVERRLVAWPNWQAELKKVAEAGRVFVDLDPSRNQFGIPGSPDTMRRPACAYFHAAEATDQLTDEGKVASVLRACNFPLKASNDPHRILFTEGLAIFSLYSIKGVQTHRAAYSDARRSRRDVPWQPLDGSPLDEQQDYHIGLLLAGLALGIIEFRPTGQFSFLTHATPTHAARVFSIDRDLADASYYLGRDHLAAEDLSKRVVNVLRLNIELAAQKLRQFNQQVEEWGVQIEGENVDNKLAFERLLPFARTIPNLISTLVGLFGDTYTPPSVEQFYQAGTGRAGKSDEHSSYRCDRCKQFLAPDQPNATLNLIPERCPSCRKLLRLDLLVGGKH